MTITRTTSPSTPLFYPEFPLVRALFIHVKKTTILREVIVSLMTTGLSPEFNIWLWDIYSAHPNWLAVLNISAPSDVCYRNKTTQQQVCQSAKKAPRPLSRAHVLRKHWFPTDKCNQGLYAHRSQQDGIFSLERSEENCN